MAGRMDGELVEDRKTHFNPFRTLQAHMHPSTGSLALCQYYYSLYFVTTSSHVLRTI